MIKQLTEVERLNAGDEMANAFAQSGVGNAGRAALVALDLAGFPRIEMILTAFLFQNLFILGNAEAFGD